MTHTPNRLCALLGSRLPLIQAPMLGSTDEVLAVAVARAGGIGAVACTGMPPADLDTMLARHRAEHPELAITYNFFCHDVEAGEGTPQPPALSTAWLTTLAPYYAREGIADPAAAVRTALASATAPFGEEQLAVLLRYRPHAVSFHFGLPKSGAHLWERLRDSGIATMASATTVAEALHLADSGVDVVIAQGLEAGGHRGIFLAVPPLGGVATQVGTFVLTPTVVRALKRNSSNSGRGPLIVVAAGGIADAAGVRCAMALGADGVQAGTAFLLCDEAITSPPHRRALREARNAPSATTELTNVVSGRPARGLENRLMRELGALRRDAPPFPQPQSYLAPLRAANTASPDYAALWCGQNAGGLRECSAAERVKQLMQGW